MQLFIMQYTTFLLYSLSTVPYLTRTYTIYGPIIVQIDTPISCRIIHVRGDSLGADNEKRCLIPALAQLALSFRRRTTLDPLAAGDLLLTLSNVVQRLTSDGLIGMLLSLCRRTTLNRLLLARDVLLSLGDLVDRRRVKLSVVLLGSVRCGVGCGSFGAIAAFVRQDALGHGRWASLGRAAGAGDGLLSFGDLVDDLAGELLANVLLSARSGAVGDGTVLIGEGLLCSGDLREDVGVNLDRHPECCAECPLRNRSGDASNWCRDANGGSEEERHCD